MRCLRQIITGWLIGIASVGSLPVVGQESTINLRETVTVDVVRRSRDAIAYISTAGVQTVPNVFGEVVRIPANSLGSGFVIHRDGYVVTNNHVIARARQINVDLADGRRFPAKLISADAGADLAILKIDSDEPLPYLPLGDSSNLMIGEPVIAVGSPLGFSNSVSTGILSAQGRDLTDAQGNVLLSDLLQTDAAINPGNSGGPLLNAYGQVIGINTAIRRDAQNLGFAIQVNKLRQLIPDLMNPAAVNKVEIAMRLEEDLKFTPPANVVSQVVLVTKDGRVPVDTINGSPLTNVVDAYAKLLAARPGTTVRLTGNDGMIYRYDAVPVQPPDVVLLSRRKLGIEVDQMTPALAGQVGADTDTGVLVTSVSRRSPAANSGLRAGDVIVGVKGRRGQGIITVPLNTVVDFGILLNMLQTRGTVTFIVVRGNQVGEFQVPVAPDGNRTDS